MLCKVEFQVEEPAAARGSVAVCPATRSVPSASLANHSSSLRPSRSRLFRVRSAANQTCVYGVVMISIQNLNQFKMTAT